jgi:hypothetical protein
MVRGLNQAMFVTPPMDVRARRGYSKFTTSTSSMCRRFIARCSPIQKVLRSRLALFRDLSPRSPKRFIYRDESEQGQSRLIKVLSINDQDVLQSGYDAYAKSSAHSCRR